MDIENNNLHGGVKPKTNIVFIPGLMNNEKLWAAQISTLSDIANCIVADITEYDNIPNLAASVLNQAPEHFILCGLSMGGYVALEIMRSASHRVLALALIDTNAKADTGEASEARRQAVKQAKQNFSDVINDMLPKIIHPFRLKDEKLISLIHSMAHSVEVEGFERQQNAIIGRIDSRPYLKEITCPTLIVCGEDDK